MIELSITYNNVLEWVIIFLALVSAGLVKGTIGFGLPLVAVSLLTIVVDISYALGIVAIPTLAANIWLAIQGGKFWWGLVRFWPLILSMAPGIWIGSSLLTRIDEQTLFLVIGAIIVTFSLIKQFTVRIHIPIKLEKFVGVLAGFTGGILGGLSTFAGPPIAIYLVSINLRKDDFIAAVGLTYTCAAVLVVIAFSTHSIINTSNVFLSLSGILPTGIGMMVGQWIRERIKKKENFSRVVLVGLLIVGVNLIRKGLT